MGGGTVVLFSRCEVLVEEWEDLRAKLVLIGEGERRCCCFDEECLDFC